MAEIQTVKWLTYLSQIIWISTFSDLVISFHANSLGGHESGYLKAFQTFTDTMVFQLCERAYPDDSAFHNATLEHCKVKIVITFWFHIINCLFVNDMWKVCFFGKDFLYVTFKESLQPALNLTKEMFPFAVYCRPSGGVSLYYNHKFMSYACKPALFHLIYL